MNLTIIMVSHENWHREYFDRVICLRDGKIEEDYRPERPDAPPSSP
ncbi:hypothetical protein [Methanogenium cariaci]|nr:hypothetical protein [Methanogenium cariaci]